MPFAPLSDQIFSRYQRPSIMPSVSIVNPVAIRTAALTQKDSVIAAHKLKATGNIEAHASGAIGMTLQPSIER